MSSSNGVSKDASSEAAASEADLAKAMAEILQGEKTAAALESNLDSLEKKIDDLLASFEEAEHLKVEEANSKRSAPSGSDSKSPDHGDTSKDPKA
ncbi:hypothetical protein HYFRA_00003681 [Hymenoscyphus fraxineus]|uniref:Uncharacterized protein n=1 Tax=Hymenoscyphus fraxineus TaxID=746836 RepID=A0A9N9PQY8_9HELO|nr:hypothetical protein HYFRA_00003681 [Hymenoscyphus fraxineus]